MILLDTSVLLQAMGIDGPIREMLRVAIADGRRVGLPALVLYEWLRGPRTQPELDAQGALLPSQEAVPFGPHEASVAADLYRAVPRPRGRELDLAIAATAISWSASLWTVNRRDFEDVPGLDLWPAG